MGTTSVTPDVLDSILRQTLIGLADELRSSTWYVSEHAVINLFVFGYLVPAFQKCEWDLTGHRSAREADGGWGQLAIFPAFSFAHRARCAAAILFLPAADTAAAALAIPRL